MGVQRKTVFVIIIVIATALLVLYSVQLLDIGLPVTLSSLDHVQSLSTFRAHSVSPRPHPALEWARNLPSPHQYKQIFHTAGLGANRGYRNLSDMVVNNLIDYDLVGGYHFPRDWFSDLDLQLLKEPVPLDGKSVASIATSMFDVVKPDNVKVGDKVVIHLHLRDGRGRPITQGGHEVRVWMLSTPRGFHPYVSKAAASRFLDLGNGSYVATLPVLWSGNVTVVAALIRPREFRGVMLRLLDKMKALFQITAGYQRGRVEEVTLCLASPVLPGYPSTCNLTNVNSGLPWYCGRPNNPFLSCSDWVRSRSTGFPEKFPMSSQERQLFNLYFASGAKYRLHHTERFTALNGQLSQPAQPCFTMAPNDTWHQEAPLGYWDRWQWMPLKCTLPTKLPVAWLDRCLANTTVLLLSDSNSRLIQEQLIAVWGCTVTNEGQSGHDPIHCRKSQLNAVVSWHTHAYPFFTRSTWANRFKQLSPRHRMDAIPSRGKYIVLIHLYAHFLVTHTYTLGLQLRDTAIGVRDLLSRNPEARVLVRGPHAMTGTEKRVIGDQHAERTLRILRQEFRSLMDRVVFLDAWDMTVANENVDIHPLEFTNKAILRQFLGHVCSF